MTKEKRKKLSETHANVRNKREVTAEHTGSLLRSALEDGALLLEVDVPVLRLAGGVLQDKGKDGVALLDGVLTVGIAGVEGRVDGVKGNRGGEFV